MSYFAFSINSLNQMVISTYPADIVYLSGLTYDSYNNNTTYFTPANSLSFFTSATKSFTGTTTSINYTNTQFNALDSLTIANPSPINFAFSFYGYFIPTSTGVWTFTFSSDDTISFWLGTANQTISSLKSSVTVSSINSSPMIVTTTPLSQFTANSITISSGTGSNAYINGAYTASASSILNSSFDVYKIFTGSTISDAGWVSANPVYTGGTYTLTPPVTTTAYNYSTSSNNTLNGEWVQIRYPYSIIITSYSLLPRGGTVNNGSFPSKWYICGSNDGSAWYLIDTQNIGLTSNYSLLQTYNVTGQTTAYSYFRMVINSIGNFTAANLLQWNITGMYGLNTYSPTLTSGTPYPLLLNFGQSNASSKCQMGITPPSSGTLTYDGTPYFFRAG
jgi:hypothetical protein